MKAQPDGFTLSFTEPVHVESASDQKNYRMESYTYPLESRYGGPEDDKKELKITKAVISEDRTRVRLHVDALRAGYVHELHIEGAQNQSQQPLLHGEAYYNAGSHPENHAALIQSEDDACRSMISNMESGEDSMGKGFASS